MANASWKTNEKMLLKKAKWLEGKTLSKITEEIEKIDTSSRVKTKAGVGDVVEKYFGIPRNSSDKPDFDVLCIELKTCPLKHTKKGELTIKEPLSLNMINYCKEAECHDIKDSSLYKKNRKILFVFYIHEGEKRSEYKIKLVFIWEMDENVLNELRPDYKIILNKIKSGKAHELHQDENEFLTTCPKHNGVYKDPKEMTSKREQPFSSILAEKRAFRIKNIYMNKIIRRYIENNQR